MLLKFLFLLIIVGVVLYLVAIVAHALHALLCSQSPAKVLQQLAVIVVLECF